MRKKLLMKAVAGAGLLFCGVSANAQYQPQYQYPNRYEQRRYDIQEQNRLLDRTRADLDRAALSFGMGPGDRYRLNAAREQLNDIQNLMSSGSFDQQELNQAVVALRRVVNNNRLSDRTRDNLERDLEQMREFRWEMRR
jgi:hypothetical protein